MADDFTTSVPAPYFGPLGFVAPIENAVLTGVQTDINTALGGGVNPQLTTPQGQLAMTETAVIGDSNAQFLYYVNGIDPALNSGRMQDAIGRIYYMTRIPSAPTVQSCVCGGLVTTPIPVGALAVDPATNLIWICNEAGIIQPPSPPGGAASVTLEFACTTNGPIAGPASLKIYQGIPGWETVAPSGDAVLGNNVETPAQFETRRQASVAANATQILDSIQGTVLALPGVLDCYCYENDDTAALVVGGVTLNPNSIYVCVLGGVQTAIAHAIWSKKAPGCAYNGNTFTTVSDPNPAYLPPAPQYVVSYTTPVVLAFAVLVTIANNPGVPSNATALVQQAVVAGFAGLDGGPRAKIGSTVYASRYYGDVIALGSWALIVSIQIGVSGAACSFQGAIVGELLTVSTVSSGALAPGQLLQDAGLMTQATLIVRQLSGPTGGAGTYQVSVPQTLASEPMNATTLVNDYTCNINQAPSASAANVMLLLQ